MAPWGRAPDGTAVECVTLASPSGVTAVLISWGATLARLLVPDRRGAPADVVLGFDELAGYTGPHPHLGGTIGRYANRIAGARFSLGGRVHHLSANEPPHHLHGGAIGFDRRPWRSQPFQAAGEAGVVFRLESADGDQGYPGTLQAEARYALGRDRRAARRALGDGPTPRPSSRSPSTPTGISRTEGRATCWATSSRSPRTPTCRSTASGSRPARSRPSRGPRSTSAGHGRCAQALRDAPDGLDHNLVLRGDGAVAARLRDPRTGRALELSTTAPGLQLYAGGGLDGSCRGRGGVAYQRHAGVCLEPQRFPDAPNRPGFGTVVLEPGEPLPRALRVPLLRRSEGLKRLERRGPARAQVPSPSSLTVG